LSPQDQDIIRPSNKGRCAVRRQWEPNMSVSPIPLRKSGLLKIALVVACIAAVTTLSPRASFAFSSEAQQMCTGDAFRLCSGEIPNIPAVTACMIKNRLQLSSGCRVVLDREVSKKGGKVAGAD
jgi:hypothetical protein